MTELKLLPLVPARDVRRLITHKNCPDGIASAMVVRRFHPHAEIVFIGYNDPAWGELRAEVGDVFCDMSPPRDRADEWVAVGAWCLDHHKHARDIVEMFGERGVYADESEDPGVSGAVLANICLLSHDDKNTCEFSHLAGIRDTWQKVHPRWDEACALSAVLTHMPQEYWLSCDPTVGADLIKDALEMSETLGPLLIAERRAKAEAIVASGMLTLRDHHGNRWGVFPDHDNLASDVGEAARDAGYDAILGYRDEYRGGSIRVKISLRSNEEIDVGAISKERGGGGHSRAAGFHTDTMYDALDACGLRAGFAG